MNELNENEINEIGDAMNEPNKAVEENLKERYHEFPVPKSKHADAAYQLCVRSSDIGKLYFINVYVYDLTKLGYSRTRQLDRISYQAECQFVDENGFTFDVVLHRDWKTIEQMEGFFEKMYESMDCVPYDN